MAPQVFEKSISCVNNLPSAIQSQRRSRHTIYVVDIQDGGNGLVEGRATQGQSGLLLTFLQELARMGGEMQYVQCDNVAFLHILAGVKGR